MNYNQKANMRKKNNVGMAVVHGVVGGVPLVGSVPESYLGMRKLGAGKGAAAVGGAAAGTVGYGLTGGLGPVALGAVHGYNFQAAKHAARGPVTHRANPNKTYKRKVGAKTQTVKMGKRR